MTRRLHARLFFAAILLALITGVGAASVRTENVVLIGTTPLAMQKAIQLMERGVIDPERVISHRFPLTEINVAVETMCGQNRNKVVVQPWR